MNLRAHAALLAAAVGTAVVVPACHPSVVNDCNDYDALALACPGAAMISATDDAKYCKAFAASSALGGCDDKNKAEYDCLLAEPNVCDQNAATTDCSMVEKAASACMKAYCENHKDDPGCARSI